MEIGTSCRFSSVRRAVTMISVSSSLLLSAAVSAAITGVAMTGPMAAAARPIKNVLVFLLIIPPSRCKLVISAECKDNGQRVYLHASYDSLQAVAAVGRT